MPYAGREWYLSENLKYLTSTDLLWLNTSLI